MVVSVMIILVRINTNTKECSNYVIDCDSTMLFIFLYNKVGFCIINCVFFIANDFYCTDGNNYFKNCNIKKLALILINLGSFW